MLSVLLLHTEKQKSLSIVFERKSEKMVKILLVENLCKKLKNR